MRIPGTGLQIVRKQTLSPVSGKGGGWIPWIVREPYTGAWQRNDEICVDNVLHNPTIFACTTLISSDIGKLRLKLMQEDPTNDIWTETTSTAFSPVMSRPNAYQNSIQFMENWIVSKLKHGNTIALKERDQRGVVNGLHILDWTRVTPLITPDGSIFYQLGMDNLAGIETGDITVPASEIIHDRWNTLFHPLIGLSPIFAAGLVAGVGTQMIRHSMAFFGNGARPSGVLTAPGNISKETAERLKAEWTDKFTGSNAGRTAILGDGLHYEPMTSSASDSQLLQQLNWGAETICSVYHVPGFKVGVGATPTYQNAELYNMQYYSQCLQTLIEQFETCYSQGLELPTYYWVELDLSGLLRMDEQTQYTLLGKAVSDSLMTVNEARKRIGLPPVEGGDKIWMQQQNYSLQSLNKRDSLPNPFVQTQATNTPDPAVTVTQVDDEAAAGKAAEFFTQTIKALTLELEVTP
jgi:HK97 family phage portal protein